MSTPSYAHLATPDAVRESDYNLKIPRCVDNFVEEDEIDIQAFHKEIDALEEESLVPKDHQEQDGQAPKGIGSSLSLVTVQLLTP